MNQNSNRQTEMPLPSPVRRNWVWLSIQVILRISLTVWVRYRAYGVEKIPSSGGGLVLVNHQSFLDPLLVGLPLRRPVSYLARDNLFRVPVIGWILRHTYVMPINRQSASTASIKESVRRMQHGFLVGIFPEGTRSSDGSVGEFKPGFIAFIRRAKLPVYPVGIAGSHDAFPRGAWFIWPRKVTIVFGDPISFEELEPLAQRGNEEQLIAMIRERVIDCQQKAEHYAPRVRSPRS